MQCAGEAARRRFHPLQRMALGNKSNHVGVEEVSKKWYVCTAKGNDKDNDNGNGTLMMEQKAWTDVTSWFDSQARTSLAPPRLFAAGLSLHAVHHTSVSLLHRYDYARMLHHLASPVHLPASRMSGTSSAHFRTPTYAPRMRHGPG
jgi:hypothetical protein